MVGAPPAVPRDKPRVLPFPKGDWTSVAVSRDSQWLFIPVPQAAQLWNLTHPKLAAAPTIRMTGPQRMVHPTFAPGSRKFASAQGSTVYLWDLEHPLGGPS